MIPVLVLCGGPDRERAVSLRSGAAVYEALKAVGFQASKADCHPEDTRALDMFLSEHPQGVVFPVMHGPWGEGGGLQVILEKAGARYVGCRADAAQLCMDKAAAKAAVADVGLQTPESEVITRGSERTVCAPVVLKALNEGSSFGVHIAMNEEQAEVAAQDLLAEFPRVMAEAWAPGPELTVGVIEDLAEPNGLRVLPPIRVVPAQGFYDFNAKYERDDTQYLFDLGSAAHLADQIPGIARRTFRALGCRHLARIDLMVDTAGELSFIEANTMPGFTDHSLLPKAAAQSGISFTELCARLVAMA